MIKNGIICTILDNTITVETSTNLTNVNTLISATLISENKIFILHYGDGYYIYGTICTINGNNVTTNTAVQISAMTNAHYSTSVVALTENKIFVTHGYGNVNYPLHGIVCTINGTDITVGDDTLLNNEYNSPIFTIALDENRVFILSGRETPNRYLAGTICKIQGTAIIFEKYITFNNSFSGTSNISSVALSENKVFIVHPKSLSSTLLCGMIFEINDFIQTATRQDTIFGVAQTKALDGQTVKVVRPNYNESEEN